MTYTTINQVAAPYPKLDEEPMPTRTTKTQQVPQGPPARVEIRINGAIRFANQCYGTQLTQTNDTISLTASLQPTMIDAPPPPKTQKFGDDPRDGDTIIQQVHSGKRS